MKIGNATIEVNVEDWHVSESFSGPADKAYAEAFDWQNTIVAQYLAAHHVTNPDEQDEIINSAYHSITWEPGVPSYHYALLWLDGATEPLIGIYATEADAQEAFLEVCKDHAAEIINTADPIDTFGREEFSLPRDFWWLVSDCGKCLDIQIVPCFLEEDW